MPKCPKCGPPMAAVLKREGGVVRMYYECPACPVAAHEPLVTGKSQDRCRWCGKRTSQNVIKWSSMAHPCEKEIKPDGSGG